MAKPPYSRHQRPDSRPDRYSPPDTVKIYGLRPILEAIAAGQTLSRVLLRRDAGGDILREVEQACKQDGIPIQRVPVQALNKFTGQEKHQGAMAFVSPVEFQNLESKVLADFDDGKAPVYVLPVGVTDVRNLGSIARTCECVGVDALLLPSKGTASLNADAVKTSAGALFHLNVVRVPHLMPALDYLQNSGFQLAGVYEEGEYTVMHMDFSDPIVLLLGAEGEGLPPEVQERCDVSMRIPLLGKTASLNVSVAAGMVLYEVLRQRTSHLDI